MMEDMGTEGTDERGARGDAESDAERAAGERGPRAERGAASSEPRWMSVSEEVVRANTSRGAGAGIQFGAVIVVFTLAGVWADRRFDTLPLFLLIGLALGFGGGLFHLMRTLGGGRRDAGS